MKESRAECQDQGFRGRVEAYARELWDEPTEDELRRTRRAAEYTERQFQLSKRRKREQQDLHTSV